MAVIDDVKALLGIEDEDNKLKVIITLTESRLKALLGQKCQANLNISLPKFRLHGSIESVLRD